MAADLAARPHERLLDDVGLRRTGRNEDAVNVQAAGSVELEEEAVGQDSTEELLSSRLR
jgi:hypothetical protein